MIKLIATDMDGTLLNDEKTFDPALFSLIKELKKKSILFAIASGRQYAGLVKIFDSVKDDILFICQNGGHIVYHGKTLYTKSIDKALSNEVIKKARTINDAYILACTSEKAYIENPAPEFLNELGQYLMTLEIVDDLTMQPDFLKVSLCDLKGATVNCAPILTDAFKDYAQVCVSGPKWFDVTDINTHKGVALNYIQNRFHISEKETMVFGDNYNDIGLFGNAYYSYAMDNAIDEIKKYANFVAPCNNDNGVIKEIVKQLNLKNVV